MSSRNSLRRLSSLTIAVLFFAFACGGEAARTDAMPDGAAPSQFVRVAEAAVDSHGAALVAQGTIAFDEEHVAAIIPPVQGRVVRLLASQGDHVGAGAPLAVVYSAEVAAAGAGLSEARINRLTAEQNLARAERLASEGAGSQRDVIEARAALGNARAEELRAGAALRAMGAPVSTAATYTLRAPIAGIVVRRAIRVGAEARPDAAEPAFLIADLAHVWVLAHLHEQQATAVHTGDAAEISVPALPGRTFTGDVQRLSDAVDPNAHTIVARISIENPQNLLKPEMFARVTIRTHGEPVVLLPTTALVTHEDGYAVFVEGARGRFERRRVVVGAELERHTQILRGIRPGERVVVEGALLLDPSVGQLL